MKAAGYCISIVSVLLLGLVAWSSASRDPLLKMALIGGMVLSIAGMGLRWRSFVVEERQKRLGHEASSREPFNYRIPSAVISEDYH